MLCYLLGYSGDQNVSSHWNVSSQEMGREEKLDISKEQESTLDNLIRQWVQKYCLSWRQSSSALTVPLWGYPWTNGNMNCWHPLPWDLPYNMFLFYQIEDLFSMAFPFATTSCSYTVLWPSLHTFYFIHLGALFFKSAFPHYSGQLYVINCAVIFRMLVPLRHNWTYKSCRASKNSISLSHHGNSCFQKAASNSGNSKCICFWTIFVRK